MKGKQRLIHSAPVEKNSNFIPHLPPFTCNPRLPPFHGLPRIHSSDSIQASVLAHRYQQVQQRKVTQPGHSAGRPRAATEGAIVTKRHSIMVTLPDPSQSYSTRLKEAPSSSMLSLHSKNSSRHSLSSVASHDALNTSSAADTLSLQDSQAEEELSRIIQSAVGHTGTGRRISLALKSKKGNRHRRQSVRHLLDKTDAQKQQELLVLKQQQEEKEKQEKHRVAPLTEYEIQRNRLKERARIRWKLAIQYAIKGVKASSGFSTFRKDDQPQDNLPIVNSSTFSEHSHKYSMKGFQTKADLAVNMRVQILMSQHPCYRSPDEISLVEKVITPKIRAFSRFNTQQRLELCRRLRYSAYPPGTVVLREGHRAYSFYIILSGQVDVLKKQNDRILKLNILNRGDSFGDIGLEGVLAAVRTASIVASSDVELLVLDREDYCDIILQGKNAEAEIMARMKLVKSIPLFRDTCVHETVMHQIVMKAQVKQYEATGTVILEEGEMNRNIYFIVSGSVTVRKTLIMDDTTTDKPSKLPPLTPQLIVTDSQETTPVLLGRTDATLQIPVLSKNYILPSDGFEQAEISSEEIAKAEKILGLSNTSIHPSSPSLEDDDSPRTLNGESPDSIKRSMSGLNLSNDPEPLPIPTAPISIPHHSRSKSAPQRARFPSTRPKTANAPRHRAKSAKPTSHLVPNLAGKVILDVATVGPGQSFPEIIPLDMLPESTVAIKVRTSPEKMGMTEDEINEAIDTEIKYKLGDVGYQYPAYSAIVTEGSTKCLILSRLDFLRVAPPIMIRQLFDRIDECYVPCKTLMAEYKDKLEWERCRERIIADTYDELKRIKHDVKAKQLTATVEKFVN